MTDTNKPVRRRTEALVREQGKLRRVIVTIYPSMVLGLRLEKTRREEYLTIHAAYGLAVKARVAQERREKAEKKKAKRT